MKPKKIVLFYRSVVIEPTGQMTVEICWSDMTWTPYFTYQKWLNGVLTESKRLEMDTQCYNNALLRRRNQLNQLKETQSETVMTLISGQAVPDPHTQKDPLSCRPVLVPTKQKIEYYPGMIRDLSVVEKDRIVARQEKELQQKQIELNALRQKTEEEYNEMMREKRKHEDDMLLRRGECDTVPEELR